MSKKAVVYRMVTDQHICPFGIKTVDLLKRKGFEVEDNHLRTREETDKFKSEHAVKTTPQTFVDGSRIGGYEDVRKYLGLSVADKNKKSYTPIALIFSTTALMALGVLHVTGSAIGFLEWLGIFVPITMCVLGILKLKDLTSFSNQFITYDLLAKRFVPYAYVYPFAETLAGLSMISRELLFVFAPVALVIGTIGAVSVFKAVYIDKRDLKCACVGGNSNVPLGFISLTENLFMIGMGLWMLI